jgi:hypothetical protein
MGHDKVGRADHGKGLISVRIRTAGWWPPSRYTRSDGTSPRRGLRAAVLAVVTVAAGMTAGSAPAASRPTTTAPVRTSAITSESGENAIWTADPGGSFKASGALQVVDAKTGAVATCSSITMQGTLETELQSGAGVGSITSAALTGCSLGKVPVKVAVHGLPWSLDATGYTAATGVVTGTISGIDLVAAGSGCSATLDGTAADAGNGLAAISYTNPPPSPSKSLGKLALSAGGNLHWWAVSGCSGLVGTGDGAQASGSSTVSPAQILTQFCFTYAPNIQLNPHFPVPTPPPGTHQVDTPVEPACAYVSGFTNVQKLNEAAFVGPAYADLAIGVAEYVTKNSSFLQLNSAGLPQYHGKPEFPPARATLLGFGFMPVTATLQLSEIGTLNAIFIQSAPGKFGCTKRKQYCGLTTITARLDIHISDVNVNGTPLNVGPDCQTIHPFTVTLKGRYPAYVIDVGGPLNGSVDIPAFKDCSDDGDNLDSIFTASVSGPGNQTLLTQGTPCGPPPGVSTFQDCPPPVPTPQH